MVILKNALVLLAAALIAPGVLAVPKPQESASSATSISAPATRDAASWGLDRIDAKTFMLDNKYTQLGSAGLKDVDVYILDSGINTKHNEFAGMPITTYNVVTGSNDVTDTLGHGTMVASIVAGKTRGVAPGVGLTVVKTHADNSPNTNSEYVTKALLWVLSRHMQPDRRSRKGIILMSYGAPANIPQVYMAVRAARMRGLLVVAAAGNAKSDACSIFPAGYAEVLAVGATAKDAKGDILWQNTNLGSCVDVLAPGDDIAVARADAVDGYGSGWGTTTAAPHVAGVAALYWGQNLGANAGDIFDRVVKSATPLPDIRDSDQVAVDEARKSLLEKTPKRMVYAG